jgi:thymidylate synthase ThyX
MQSALNDFCKEQTELERGKGMPAKEDARYILPLSTKTQLGIPSMPVLWKIS